MSTLDDYPFDKLRQSIDIINHTFVIDTYINAKISLKCSKEQLQQIYE